MQTNLLPFPVLSTDCPLITAKVKSVADRTVLIETSDGLLSAEKAFSCLVAPITNDMVLVSKTQGQTYILAVLERNDSTSITMQFPGDITLSGKGALQVKASKDIEFAAPAISLAAHHTSMTNNNLKIVADTITTNAHSADIHIKNQNIFSETITIAAHQITERVHTLLRWVEGVESLTIGSLIQKVRNTFVSNANQAVITAQSDMRIDGERIHMG